MCILGRCTLERHPAVMGATKIYSLLEKMQCEMTTRRDTTGRDAKASRGLTGIESDQMYILQLCSFEEDYC